MENEEAPEKRCVICGAALEGVAAKASGEYRCRRCGCTGRYEGEGLVALFIPDYHARLMELEALNREVLNDINLEGMKGEYRDMKYLQRKHLERQDILAEYSFLTYFKEYIDKW